VATGKLVLAAIARVNRELGSTTVVITHNAVIADMADRVLQLADGQVTADRHNATKRAPEELAW
jgi:putative ABC transport system ATP-binding protein